MVITPHYQCGDEGSIPFICSIFNSTQMTEQEIFKFGEIQYLTGRLDELYYKALPNVLDLHGNRGIDIRIGKYLDKLKSVDETAYYLYMVEYKNRSHARNKSQNVIKNILTEVLEHVSDETIKVKIQKHIAKYRNV